MKVLAASLLAASLIALLAVAEPAPEPKPLFDGETLAGWSHFLVDDTVKKEDVWSVEDGVLVCQGTPVGYLYTDKSYGDFHLSLEWRWAPGKGPGNSGVLLRIQGEARSFLPKCVEAQLQNGNAGDIWGFYGASVEGDADRAREVKDHKDLGDFRGVGKLEGAEKAPGEWNRYDITLKGGTLELRVNGTLVNQATGLDEAPGPIGLQSEGGEIHFRKIEITED